MRQQIEVDEATGMIKDAKFKTFGCGSAIASSSLATEWLKGKSVDEAVKIDNMTIVEELNLPPVKIHCSVLAEDAIKAAVNDYRQKQQERLEEIASRYAQKAIDYRSPSYVRGLSSYERKVVHEYVTKNYPELTSYSTGEGRDRRLVIDAKGNEPQPESAE